MDIDEKGKIFVGKGTKPEYLTLALANRHGLVAGATGTGKTVTLQVLDVSSVHSPHPAAKALYFTVRNLEAAFERAAALGCLSREDVHDAPGGGIVVRPWGERSFYAEDPWGNPLCFVEEGTVYTG